MNYTQKHEEIMLEMSIQEQDEEIFEEDVLEYLQDETSFMSFGEGIRRIIRKKMPESYYKDERKFLKEKANEQSIKFNKNTVDSWFDGTPPKKGDKDRERMFLVCFALKLDLEETIELFQKVYCDRPFNFRNYKEFIYFCCINNGWDYDHAQSLINQIEFSEDVNDHTIYTSMMHNNALGFNCDDEIIQYIYNNPHNFDIRNYTAKANLKELIWEIRGRKDETTLLQNRKIDDQCSYIAQECYYNPLMWDMLRRYESDTEDEQVLPRKSEPEEIRYADTGSNDAAEEKDPSQESELKEIRYADVGSNDAAGEKVSLKNKKKQNREWSNKSFHSLQTMVDIIYGIRMKDAREDGNSGFIKNSRLPQAVKGRFPDQQTLKKINSDKITTEELRKMIILLFSYKFWFLKKYKNKELGFEEYRDGLNDLLYESYLQKLYMGNPFDWIFMFCTLSEDSLSLFRTLMGEGLLGE